LCLFYGVLSEVGCIIIVATGMGEREDDEKD
jgi:hypothetical protein